MCAAPSALKYQHIELVLQKRIQDGIYAGTTLPGERELAEEFKVARVTVRSALQRLLERGLLVRLRARGPLVTAGNFGTTPKRLLRERVDKFLDRGRQDHRRVIGYARVKATAAITEALELPAATQVLRVIRLRWDTQSPLTYTIAHIGFEHAVAMSRAALARKAMVQLLMEAGVRIGAAEQTVEAARAPTEVAKALHLAADDPVLKLNRVVRDQSGHVVQLLEGWYRADRFSIRMLMSPSDDATTVWIEPRS